MGYNITHAFKSPLHLGCEEETGGQGGSAESSPRAFAGAQGTGAEPAGRSPRGERWAVLGVCSR